MDAAGLNTHGVAQGGEGAGGASDEHGGDGGWTGAGVKVYLCEAGCGREERVTREAGRVWPDARRCARSRSRALRGVQLRPGAAAELLHTKFDFQSINRIPFSSSIRHAFSNSFSSRSPTNEDPPNAASERPLIIISSLESVLSGSPLTATTRSSNFFPSTVSTKTWPTCPVQVALPISFADSFAPAQKNEEKQIGRAHV